MTAQQKKRLRQKHFMSFLMAFLLAALTGRLLAPLASPLLKPFIPAGNTVLFGQTFSQDILILTFICVALFLILWSLLSFILREKHGRHDKSGQWFMAGIAVMALAGACVFLFLNKDKISFPTLPQTSEKHEAGYKKEDRQQLEQLIHKGATHD